MNEDDVLQLFNKVKAVIAEYLDTEKDTIGVYKFDVVYNMVISMFARTIMDRNPSENWLAEFYKINANVEKHLKKELLQESKD